MDKRIGYGNLMQKIKLINKETGKEIDSLRSTVIGISFDGRLIHRFEQGTMVLQPVGIDFFDNIEIKIEEK